MIKLLFCTTLLFSPIAGQQVAEITPYKFTDADRHPPQYSIPESSRFTVPRSTSDAPDIVYYLSKPSSSSYPITILCEGSTDADNVCSVIHLHRYFLQELLDLGSAVLTIERWGVNGNKINKKDFLEHYTRSQRFYDHCAIIEYFKNNPPSGWNGKLIFIGVSEGGPLVTSLTTQYADSTLATINWCGAVDWPWREEIWAFIIKALADAPWWVRIWKYTPRWMPLLPKIPRTRADYDKQMDETLAKPVADKFFFGMTYKYHADALLYPPCNYTKIRTPFLVVSGVQDNFIASSDDFVAKAHAAGAPVTYLRVSDMDHYVRRRPEILAQSFEWLKQQIPAPHIPHLPKPTGPHGVGSVTYYLTDYSRTEKYAPTPGAPREVIIQAWYPSHTVAQGKRSKYLGHILPALKAKLKGTNLNHLDHFELYAIDHAPFNDSLEKCPVVIFSPGFGVSRQDYSTLFDELASYGYCVVAIDHPYTNLTARESGEIISTTPIDTCITAHDMDSVMLPAMDTWIKDTRFVLDELERINQHDPHGILTHRLDFNALGIFGHSLGGIVALHVCAIDKRCKAAVNMDGDLLNSDGTWMIGGLHKPYLLLFAQTIHALPAEVQEFKDKSTQARQAFVAASTTAECQGIPGANHFTFSDACVVSPGPHSFDPIQGIAMTRAALVRFFNHHLLSSCSTQYSATQTP